MPSPDDGQLCSSVMQASVNALREDVEARMSIINNHSSKNKGSPYISATKYRLQHPEPSRAYTPLCTPSQARPFIILLRALELIVLARSFKLHSSREQVLPMQESSRYGNLVRPYYSALQVPFFRNFRTLKLGEEKLQLREDLGTHVWGLLLVKRSQVGLWKTPANY